MNDRTKQIIERARTKDSLEQEFKLTLMQRVGRYLKAKPHSIIPNTPFAAASSECSCLYRDGHFYGCISLTQSVSEALVKFLCRKNGWRPNKDYEKNVGLLHTRKFITTQQKRNFLIIWEKRDDYHHLNTGVERELRKLDVLALKKIQLLIKLESEFFAFSVNMGVLKPKYPKYWK